MQYLDLNQTAIKNIGVNETVTTNDRLPKRCLAYASAAIVAAVLSVSMLSTAQAADKSTTTSATSKSSLTARQERAKALVMPFYTQVLTTGTGANVEQLLGQMLTDNFQSINGAEVKDKATMIGSIAYFRKLIPNLAWEPQDVVVSADGAKVVVRSMATGSPKGNFFGLDLDGSKSFKIDTIDIHDIENGHIARIHHLEDWAAAVQQLKQ